jgi:hypothetical protein
MPKLTVNSPLANFRRGEYLCFTPINQFDSPRLWCSFLNRPSGGRSEEQFSNRSVMPPHRSDPNGRGSPEKSIPAF